ncbi:hypothetical protein PanWU01x14_344130 [Parasponia andersonii]|uniref:Uncharacterized protein n=1 Tax=Parasponia andersonii TaxID=3476 RepID=A0A2P5AD67_PARAD|nr:hypothetical protein PanWU01x14_344130 [Parasponia andersonii]
MERLSREKRRIRKRNKKRKRKRRRTKREEKRVTMTTTMTMVKREEKLGEKIGSESEADIIEKGIQASVGLGDYKEEERGEKAKVEKIVATKRLKQVMKPVDKFIPIEKKKTLQKSVPVKPNSAIQAPRKQRICPFSITLMLK